MESNPCREFSAEMLEDNVLEWHFTMLGPAATPYEKGFYHGKILIPADYPFKPPDVVLLTPNGRFELDKRICLSISSYHPENWHPTWGISTVLHALREFMATPGNNAIGAIEYPKYVREELAEKSVHFCCAGCGRRVEDVREAMLQHPLTSEVDKSKRVEERTPKLGPASIPRDEASSPPQPILSEDARLECLGDKGRSDEPASPLALPPAETAGTPTLRRHAEESIEGGAASHLMPEAEAVPAAEPEAHPPAAAVPLPQADVPPVRMIDFRGGEFVVNVSITSIDRVIRVLLFVIAAVLCKKAVVDHYDALTQRVGVETVVRLLFP